MLAPWLRCSVFVLFSQSLAVYANTTVSWGYNSRGQLGLNSTYASAFPTTVITDAPSAIVSSTVITQLSAGAYHSLASDSRGAVYAWGDNDNGQLGDNTTSQRLVPIQVGGLLSGKTVISIASGYSCSAAVTSDGAIYTWGYNGYGQLGDGSNLQRQLPSAVVLPSGKLFSVVVAGSSFMAALSTDGLGYAWGINSDGELGTGSYSSSNVPVAVYSGGVLSGKTITQLAAGSKHALAILNDGTVVTWGNNSDGELGNGTNTNASTPVLINTLTQIKAVAGGSTFSLALSSSGTVYAWGANDYGQLGLNNTTSYLTPQVVTALAGKVVTAIACGSITSYALTSDGILYAWGDGSYNQLGVGSPSSSLIPVPVSTLNGSSSLYGLSVRALARGSTNLHMLAVASVPDPVISSLTLTHASVTAGDSASITPVFSGGVGTLSGIGSVVSGTSYVVSPMSTTTYTLTVTNTDSVSVSSSAMLTIVPLPLATSLTLGVSEMTLGRSTTLIPVFDTGSGGSVSLTGFSGSIVSNSTYTISPSVSTTYTLTVVNSLGVTAIKTATVTINAAPIPSLSFVTAGPVNLITGQSYTNAVTSNLSGGSYGAIVYSSSDTSVATVSTGGVVQAVAQGNAIITATQIAVTGYNASSQVSYSLNVAAPVPTKVPASISIGQTTQTYTGKPLSVSVTCNPVQVSAAIVYYPGFNPPVEPGTYYVLVNVVDSIYYGSLSSVFTILPAAQSISISAVDNLMVGIPVKLQAVVTDQGLVTYTVMSGNASLSGALLTAHDTNPIVIQASDAGSRDYLPVTQTITLKASSYDPPRIVAASVSQIVSLGDTATLQVVAEGNDLRYQWYLNGAPVVGATSNQLVETHFSTIMSGTYTCAVSNKVGVVTSPSVELSINSTHVANLSARTTVGSNSLVAGFVNQGSKPKNLIIRGDGPALSQFGVSGVLQNPSISVVGQAGQMLGMNSGWNNSSTLAHAFNQVGAFAFSVNSTDAALNQAFSPGIYSVALTGAVGVSGQAMLEIYDADLDSSESELINLSVRADAVSSSNPLVAGFVIAGNTTETVLIRAIGPTLGDYGISPCLNQPSLKLYGSNGLVLNSNTGWMGDPSLVSVFNQVGAFMLPRDSADCAMLVTLTPGAYTVQVTGMNGSQGSALIEVYKVSSP